MLYINIYIKIYRC